MKVVKIIGCGKLHPYVFAKAIGCSKPHPYWRFMNKILLILHTIFLLSCTGGSEMTTAEISPVVGPDELIDFFSAVSIVGDEREWWMETEHMKRFNTERRWIAYNVYMETLGVETKNYFRADSVFVSDVSNIWTGMGNVVVITPRGTLNTDLIHWNRMDDRIHAPEDVHLIRDDHEFWGDDLHTNSSMDFVNLNNVRGAGQVVIENQ